MELFHNNGHLTDDGLQAILDGTLDDLQSLEAAEHLSFCDPCLAKYTALLEPEDVLMAPQEPLKEPVMRRIRRRAARILFSKYTTVAAAAGLVLVLWGSGIFTAPVRAENTPEEPRTPLAMQLNERAAALGGALNGFFEGLSDRTSGKGSANAEEAARQQRLEKDQQTIPAPSNSGATAPDSPASGSAPDASSANP